MTSLLVLFVFLLLLGPAAMRWGVDSRDRNYSLGTVLTPAHRRRHAR